MADHQSSLLLSDRQRIQWLRLLRTENVGPATFRDLINRYGSAEVALGALPELAASGGAKRLLRIPDIAEAEAELEATQKAGGRIAAIGEADYPGILKTMSAPPPLLSILGSSDVFHRPAVAIVGARNASLSGIKIARQMAQDLAVNNHTVVSGLARGIDTAAHQGSLEGATIAVLAGGLGHPYPSENIPLMHSIVEQGGAIVTEMAFDWQPRAQDFPRRNRIIAGLCLGLVVIEAAKRSGSLISARLAGEMGRLVFACPGSPLDPRARGSNHLLKEGAILVTDANDVLEHLAPMAGANRDLFTSDDSFDETEDLMPMPLPGHSERELVIQCLGTAPTPVDEIIRYTNLTAAQVQLVLLELDLAGRLERHAGNQVSMLM